MNLVHGLLLVLTVLALGLIRLGLKRGVELEPDLDQLREGL